VLTQASGSDSDLESQLVSELLVINRGETGFIAGVENLLGCRRIEVYVGFRRENQNRTARRQSLPAQLEVADYVDRFVVTARDAKTTFDAISFNDGINACGNRGQWQRARTLPREMRESQVQPNVICFNARIKT
jgi:pentatricopeptide repeat protein